MSDFKVEFSDDNSFDVTFSDDSSFDITFAEQGAQGPEGPQGSYQVKLYVRSATEPTSPTDAIWTPGVGRGSVSTNAAGWSLVVPSGTDQLWEVENVFDPSQDTNISTWSSVFQGGSEGPAGAQGPVGQQGAAGPTGQQGSRGETGQQGATGATGSQGQQGAPGPQGATGQQGVAGATGPQGQQGSIGQQGAVGQQGPQGETGPQGQQGAAGPTGQQGAQGDSGAAGVPLYSKSSTWTAQESQNVPSAHFVLIHSDGENDPPLANNSNLANLSGNYALEIHKTDADNNDRQDDLEGIGENEGSILMYEDDTNWVYWRITGTSTSGDIVTLNVQPEQAFGNYDNDYAYLFGWNTADVGSGTTVRVDSSNVDNPNFTDSTGAAGVNFAASGSTVTASLVNSAITINNQSVSLGGAITISGGVSPNVDQSHFGATVNPTEIALGTGTTTVTVTLSVSAGYTIDSYTAAVTDTNNVPVSTTDGASSFTFSANNALAGNYKIDVHATVNQTSSDTDYPEHVTRTLHVESKYYTAVATAAPTAVADMTDEGVWKDSGEVSYNSTAGGTGKAYVALPKDNTYEFTTGALFLTPTLVTEDLSTDYDLYRFSDSDFINGVAVTNALVVDIEEQ